MHPFESDPSLAPLSVVLSEHDESVDLLTAHLLKVFGPLLDTKALAQVLRYPSTGALERSLQRGHLLLLPIVRVPHRRGSFALATDVAKFVMSLKSSRPGDIVDGSADGKGAQRTG
jgi:hypothetical protein